MDYLSEKTLVMLIGPSAIGKSTIMNQVVELDSRFARVKSFTTRPRRDNDEIDQYFYLDQDQLAELASTKQIVSQVTYPTTGQVYGTLTSSYPGQYNLLDTLANSVETYRGLPFLSTSCISLTTTVEKYRQWFLQRYPIPSPEAEKRLAEAQLSINWSLSQTAGHHWLVNDASPREVAERLIAIATGQSEGKDGQSQGRAILELIEKGEIWPNQ